METQPRLSGRFFRVMLRHFGGTGALRAAILEGTGVAEGDLEDPAFDLLVGQQIRQMENLDRLCGEGWAIKARELWSHASFGPLGAATQYAPDLGAALAVIVGHGKSQGTLWHYALRQEGEFTVLVYAPHVKMTPRFQQVSLEIAYIAVRHLLYLFLGRAPAEAVFRFPAPEPAYADDIRDAVGGAVAFGARQGGVVVPTAWLEARSALHDPAAYRLATLQLRTDDTSPPSDAAILARVAGALRALPERPKLAAVARQLRLSQRSLGRHLKAAGASFRDLAEAEQRRRAEEILSMGQAKVAQVAEQLGYSDVASFARARRRWARVAPT